MTPEAETHRWQSRHSSLLIPMASKLQNDENRLRPVWGRRGIEHSFNPPQPPAGPGATGSAIRDEEAVEASGPLVLQI